MTQARAGTERAGPPARIRPWAAQDRALLDGLLGDPAMTLHLGGPESRAQLDARHARYLATPGQFAIVDAAGGAAVGWVGFWERAWQRRPVYEIGWSVLPAFQGRGLAAAATRLALDAARATAGPREVHAFPDVANAASNALCRRLGFALRGTHELEYPAGTWIRCNDWALVLDAAP